MYQNSYYKKWYVMTDTFVVRSLCSSLKQMQLNKNISQEELAKQFGLS
jgi:hypothetical protein